MFPSILCSPPRRVCAALLFLTLSGLVAGAGTAGTAPPAVSDTDMVMAGQTFGGLRRDLSAEGNPLRIGGRSYASGLGAHAVSEIPVTVPGDAVRFTGAVGVDDGAGAGKGSVQFRILSGNAVLDQMVEPLADDVRVRRAEAQAVLDEMRRAEPPVDAAVLRQAYCLYREWTHRAALLEQPALAPAAEFAELRSRVQAIWREIMERPSPQALNSHTRSGE